MPSRVVKPIAPTLADQDNERVVRELRAKIVELQRSPLASSVLVLDIELHDGISTPVAHKLGRAPIAFFTSPPRGPTTIGRIEEVVSSGHDPSLYLVLEANGFGTTVSVDVLVM